MPYLPALRFHALSWAYDPIAMRVVRAREWRPAVVEAVDPRPGRRILDLGCGTGTLCLMLKARCPEAEVIGLDPDPGVLDRARRKAAAAGLAPVFRQGSATGLPRSAPFDAPFDVGVASLMLHHLDRAGKRAALAEAAGRLGPGGRMVIADWGPTETVRGRLGYGLTQLFDGFTTTAGHADGAFLDLLPEAGLAPPVARGRWPTPVGTLCLYTADRAPRRSA